MPHISYRYYTHNLLSAKHNNAIPTIGHELPIPWEPSIQSYGTAKSNVLYQCCYPVYWPHGYNSWDSEESVKMFYLKDIPLRIVEISLGLEWVILTILLIIILFAMYKLIFFIIRKSGKEFQTTAGQIARGLD